MLSHLLHLHHRKRFHQREKGLHPYPHPRLSVRTLDKVAVAAGIIGPLMTLPQAWKIFTTQDASGVSALSWFSFTLVAVIWLFYGIFHREKPIVIAQSMWILVNITVIMGVWIYG